MAKQVGMIPQDFYDNTKLENASRHSKAICEVIQAIKDLPSISQDNFEIELLKEENIAFAEKYENLMKVILDKNERALDLWDEVEYGILFVKHIVTIDDKFKRFLALNALKEVHNIYYKSHEGITPRLTSKQLNAPIFEYTEPTENCPRLNPLTIARLARRQDVVDFLLNHLLIIHEEDRKDFEENPFSFIRIDMYLKDLISSTNSEAFRNTTMEIVSRYIPITFRTQDLPYTTQYLKWLIALENPYNERIIRIMRYHPEVFEYLLKNVFQPYLKQKEKNAELDSIIDKFTKVIGEVCLNDLFSSNKSDTFEKVMPDILSFYFPPLTTETIANIAHNLKILLAFDDKDNTRIKTIVNDHPEMLEYIFKNIFQPYTIIQERNMETIELDVIMEEFVSVITDKHIKPKKSVKTIVNHVVNELPALTPTYSYESMSTKVKTTIAKKLIERGFPIEEINKNILIPLLNTYGIFIENKPSGFLNIYSNISYHHLYPARIGLLELFIAHIKTQSLSLNEERSYTTIPDTDNDLVSLQNALRNNPNISEIKLFYSMIGYTTLLQNNPHVKTLNLLCQEENQQLANLIRNSANVENLEISSYMPFNLGFLPAVIRAHPNLKNLKLYTTQVGSNLYGIIDVIEDSNLRSIELIHFSSSPSSIRKILQNTKLESITLSGIRSFHTSAPESLDITLNNNLKSVILKDINLSNNHSTIISIVKAIEKSDSIEKLVLDNVYLEGAKVKHKREIVSSIVSMIKHNKSIKNFVLDLDVPYYSIKELSEAIIENKSITHMTLILPPESKQHVHYLANIIEKNTSITHLDLSQSLFNVQRMEPIFAALTYNKTITSIALNNSYSSVLHNTYSSRKAFNKNLGNLLLENNTIKNIDLPCNPLFDNLYLDSNEAKKFIAGLRGNSSLTSLNIRSLGKENSYAIYKSLKTEMIKAIIENPNRTEPLVSNLFSPKEQKKINAEVRKNAERLGRKTEDSRLRDFVTSFTEGKADNSFVGRVKEKRNIHLNATKKKIADLVYDKLSNTDDETKAKLLKFLDSTDDKAKAEFTSTIMQELSKVNFKGAFFSYKKDSAIWQSIAECLYGLIMYAFDKGESFKKWKEKHTEITITDNQAFRKSLKEVKLDDILNNIKELIPEQKSRG